MESRGVVAAQIITNRGVSIPFKREGTWKVAVIAMVQMGCLGVSIPFKREGTWKAAQKKS